MNLKESKSSKTNQWNSTAVTSSDTTREIIGTEMNDSDVCETLKNFHTKGIWLMINQYNPFLCLDNSWISNFDPRFQKGLSLPVIANCGNENLCSSQKRNDFVLIWK